MSTTYLDFEKSVAELDSKIADLERLNAKGDTPAMGDELKKLKSKASKQLRELYSNLNAWRKTQVARHPERPHLSDYIENVFEDFQELAGDRVFGNDEAVIGGLASLKGRSVVIIGHEKGRTTESRLKHNFGMAHPEGYRKAARLMDLAEKFNLPVLSFPDTAGAYPGKAGEERGQAEAIARGTQRGLMLGVPFVTLIIGEGMSGGAIGIAAANTVLMMEHAIYSVISPEGCASILYPDKRRPYRKAARLMDLAEKFNLPVLSFPDTAGAYPGKAGEERGQAEAIARGTQRGLMLGVPFVTLIIGEGMSGGAIGIAAANTVLMMEHAIYSVISPEGCASILYRDAAKAKEAAEAMKITAPDLLKMRIIDGIVKEPVGGAHRDPAKAYANVSRALDKALKDLEGKTPRQLRQMRRDRFYAIGREGI